MAGILKDGGEMALRFSLARDDKKDITGTRYFVHDPDRVIDILKENGLQTKRHPDLPDPAGRNFTWVDIAAQKRAALSL
jgi:hypothetical protein